MEFLSTSEQHGLSKYSSGCNVPVGRVLSQPGALL